MKKVREKDIQGFEVFCIITALAAAVLCILFLFNVIQNHWFLNFILGLGVLLHVALFLLAVLRHKIVPAVTALVFVVFYGGGLVYFNFL